MAIISFYSLKIIFGHFTRCNWTCLLSMVFVGFFGGKWYKNGLFEATTHKYIGFTALNAGIRREKNIYFDNTYITVITMTVWFRQATTYHHKWMNIYLFHFWLLDNAFDHFLDQKVGALLTPPYMTCITTVHVYSIIDTKITVYYYCITTPIPY